MEGVVCIFKYFLSCFFPPSSPLLIILLWLLQNQDERKDERWKSKDQVPLCVSPQSPDGIAQVIPRSLSPYFPHTQEAAQGRLLSAVQPASTWEGEGGPSFWKAPQVFYKWFFQYHLTWLHWATNSSEKWLHTLFLINPFLLLEEMTELENHHFVIPRNNRSS